MTKSADHKLREAVAKAYEEGFLDGAGHGNLRYKYPPHRVAWLNSNTRYEHFPALTEAQSAEVLAWEDANYGGRKKIAQTPKAEGLEP